MRTVTVDGYKMMLNGQRLFLAGYGDDAIYPMTIAAPREKAPCEYLVLLCSGGLPRSTGTKRDLIAE